MTDDDINEIPLDDTQKARAAALAYARSTLADSNGGPFTSHDAVPKRFGTQELIDVAQWILDGTDPLAEYREESAKRIVVVRVPDDQVDAVERLNQVPSEDFPGGLLIVPESASHRDDGQYGDDEQTIEFPVPPAPPGSVQRQQGAD